MVAEEILPSSAEMNSFSGGSSSSENALLERCFAQFMAVRSARSSMSVQQLTSTAAEKGIKMMHFCVLRSKLLELRSRIRKKKQGKNPFATEKFKSLSSALSDLLVIVSVHAVVGSVKSCVEKAIVLSHGVESVGEVTRNKHLDFTKEILCDFLNLMMHSNRFWRLDIVNRIDKEFGRGVLDRDERLALKDSLGKRTKETAELIFVKAGIFLAPGTIRRWRVTAPERSGQFVFALVDILDESPILRAEA